MSLDTGDSRQEPSSSVVITTRAYNRRSHPSFLLPRISFVLDRKSFHRARSADKLSSRRPSPRDIILDNWRPQCIPNPVNRPPLYTPSSSPALQE